jgi:hypothetical protein
LSINWSLSTQMPQDSSNHWMLQLSDHRKWVRK